MSTDKKLIAALWSNVDKVSTEHITLVDSRFFTPEEVPEIAIPKDRNLLWSEPLEGLYLVDVNIARYFRDTCNSVEELFREAVQSGYTVRSKAFRVPLRLRYIPPVQSISPRIAVLTLFSSKAKAKIWQSSIGSMELPYNTTVDLVLGDNSGTAITDSIAIAARKLGKYSRVHTIPLGNPYVGAPGEEYLKPEKHAHVAVLYSKALTEIVDSYEYILKIEDDVEPPRAGFVRLFEQMKRLENADERVACVAGYYRQKISPDIPCFSLEKEIWGGAPRIGRVPDKLFKVEMQGGGFSLYNTKALKEVLPYRLTYKTIKNSYYMTGWDGTIGEVWNRTGWLQYCDGFLYCEHHF